MAPFCNSALNKLKKIKQRDPLYIALFEGFYNKKNYMIRLNLV